MSLGYARKTPKNDLGTCCTCRRRPAKNIVTLNIKAPIPGKGWGCLRCGLPLDGAISVLCDECVREKKEIVRVCIGRPADELRTDDAMLAGEPFDHDYSKHPEIRKGTRT